MYCWNKNTNAVNFSNISPDFLAEPDLMVNVVLKKELKFNRLLSNSSIFYVIFLDFSKNNGKIPCWGFIRANCPGYY
jgi:hypothetical protein